MLKKRDSSIWFMKSEIRNSALSEGYVSTWRYVQNYKNLYGQNRKRKGRFTSNMNLPFLCICVMNKLISSSPQPMPSSHCRGGHAER